MDPTWSNMLLFFFFLILLSEFANSFGGIHSLVHEEPLFCLSVLLVLNLLSSDFGVRISLAS